MRNAKQIGKIYPFTLPFHSNLNFFGLKFQKLYCDY